MLEPDTQDAEIIHWGVNNFQTEYFENTNTTFFHPMKNIVIELCIVFLKNQKYSKINSFYLS